MQILAPGISMISLKRLHILRSRQILWLITGVSFALAVYINIAIFSLLREFLVDLQHLSLALLVLSYMLLGTSAVRVFDPAWGADRDQKSRLRRVLLDLEDIVPLFMIAVVLLGHQWLQDFTKFLWTSDALELAATLIPGLLAWAVGFVAVIRRPWRILLVAPLLLFSFTEIDRPLSSSKIAEQERFFQSECVQAAIRDGEECVTPCAEQWDDQTKTRIDHLISLFP